MGAATRLQPRADIGTFADKLQTLGGITLTPDVVDTRRLDGAIYVLGEYSELEVNDHSGSRPHGTVELGEMRDPDLARGNCWAATSEIIEHVDPGEFLARELNELTIDGNGQHVALHVVDGDGEYIVDYTARQFNADLPFPFVASYHDWKTAIEMATGRAWTMHDYDDDECRFCGESLSDRGGRAGVCDDCVEEQN
jgi:hypothetical protein